MNPRFYFSICQVGAEKAVKAEMSTLYPHLRFAFSRPGFITFKEEDDRKPLIQNAPGVFTRLWGEVKDQVKSRDEVQALLDTIPAQAIVHTFEKDSYVPGDEIDGYVPNAKMIALALTFSKAFLNSHKMNAEPKIGDRVYDLIWVDDFHVFLGTHIHTAKLDPSTGNQPAIALPPNSPSRAYLKIAEAVHRFQPKIEKGMQVLEVGCSPGGATTAMLSWGMTVVGVDPKFMDASVSKNPNFKFIQKTADLVNAHDLLEVNPDWLVMDMNIAPLEALDQLAHILSCLRQNHGPKLKLKMGFLTIKLNDWKFAESIPLYLRRIEECGFRDLTVTQLSSNRQEFFVLAKSFHQRPLIKPN